ncbi:hypothetical protein O3M35_003815 [Rhynocoris fuscipes]|uniref:Integrator complex subunit 12 n=1 Tax=Rhynocoris fuscipes TaxID=488301 RepID=A0AAW1CGC2_9HEMI
MSSNTEIEPWAMKTLLLLQSRSEDAPYKLREMLVETIQQKYGGRRTWRPVPPVPRSWLAEFRAKKQLNQDGDEFMRRVVHSESPVPRSPDSNVSESSDSSSDESKGIMIEMVEDELSCIVCNEVGGNPYDLVECAECHSHYHKECHSPPISDRDVSDPRVVWYCRRCAKTIRVTIPSSLSSLKHAAKTISVKSTTHGVLSSPPIVSKHFGGSYGTPSKKINVSKLATNIVQLKGHSPTINIISADKRLQIMKKKAARKQDKRSAPK